MKYSVKKYAKALASALADKKIDDNIIAVNFLKLLKKNQDVKKALHIITMTESLLLKKTGNKKVTLEIARKTNMNNIKKAFVKKGDKLEEKINPRIIAGVKIKVNEDKQLDLSLLNKLENIF